MLPRLRFVLLAVTGRAPRGLRSAPACAAGARAAPPGAAARRGHGGRDRSACSAASIAPAENRARDALPASARHPAVLRHQARHDRGRGVARRRTAGTRKSSRRCWPTPASCMSRRCPRSPGNEFVTASLASFSDEARRPAGSVRQGRRSPRWVPDGADIAPPGSADLVVTFRNMHNWMNLGLRVARLSAAMHRALEAGRHSRRGRASRRPGTAAGSARHQRLRERGIRHSS